MPAHCDAQVRKIEKSIKVLNKKSKVGNIASCLNFWFYEHTKNQFIPLTASWDTANFSVWRLESPHTFLTKPTPIFFNELLISMNIYQHAKKQAFSSFSSRDIVDLKILQSDWPRAFWPIP